MELIYKDSTKTIKERVQHLMSLMTLEEKIGQLHQMVSNEQNVLEACELARQGKLGSRILASTAFAGNETQVAGDGEINNLIQRVAMEESRLGIPVINGRDVIHGYRTVFPVPLAQAATFDCELVEQSCHISAKEAINGGVHWTFAPMIDVSRDARWGRIIESFGEDPLLNAKLGQASIKGYQGSDLSHPHAIAACAKHYIGYGASEGGRDYESVEISDNTLRNTYLKPFKAAVKSGVATVMSGFHENNGEPITASSYWLNDVLKDELGFDGFVISDWASVAQLIHQGVASNRKDAAQIGLNAGVDMDMVSNCYLEYLVDLVKEGKVKERVIDAACGKILTLKFKLGLFENPYTEIKPEQDVQLLPEHLKCAREIAAKSIVLLKNKDNVLPFSKTDESVALVGPFSHERRALLGSWTLDGKASDVVNLVEGVKIVAPTLDLRTCETALSDEMIACIRRANKVVVALGESHVRNGEANSVADIVLPPGQEELLEMISRFGKPIVTIIFAGRPLDLTRVMRYSDAILYAWHPGVQGGLAVADVLFGDVAPSGKLPVTFPRQTGQLPLYYNHKRNGRGIDEYYEPSFYLNYHDTTAAPLFPFGYGLSYTTFEYDALGVEQTPDDVKVLVEVKNSGRFDGEEIVQCYLQDEVSSSTRPIRELVGFKRISLKAQESTVVTFVLSEEEIGFYNRRGDFIVEPGDYTIYVGTNSQATLKIRFNR